MSLIFAFSPLLDGKPAGAAEYTAVSPQPMAFEVNRGQTAREVRYLARGKGYILYLAPGEAVLSLEQAHRDRVLRMRLAGSADSARFTGVMPLPGRRNYYVGDDPTRWRTGIPTYREVVERGVYPGIDVAYHGRNGVLEYDFMIAPGADPAAVRLAFSGADGMNVDAHGDLVLTVGGARVIHHAPYAYQLIDGGKVHVTARYVQRGHTVAFQVGRYDPDRPLIVDPALNYADYLGGSGNDEARAVAVDGSGNVYLTGQTGSVNFPTGTSAGPTTKQGTYDAFVTKLDASGNVVFSTYLGSDSSQDSFAPQGGEKGNGIAVDSQGQSVYVTGGASGGGFTLNAFPTTSGAYNSCPITNPDVFVSILDGNDGRIQYSTCIGGGLTDEGLGIAVDTNGVIYVAGYTTSVTPSTSNTSATPFPTTTAAISSTKASQNDKDGIFFEFDASKIGSSQLVYSTYLGGSQDDYANAVAVDSGGLAYVAGRTSSSADFLPFAFPAGSYQSTNAGGQDAFVLEIDPSATTGPNSLKRATFFGGSSDDAANGIAVTATDTVYIAGSTTSSDLPVKNSSTLTGSESAFVTRLNLAAQPANALVYSTYLGGSGIDLANAIAVDGASRAYVTGSTTSIDFPVTVVSGVPNQYGGPSAGAVTGDAFVTSLSSNGTDLNYSAYLGGSGDDEGRGITLDSKGNAYVTGGTKSPLTSGSASFPVTSGSHQGANAGNPGTQDAFIARIGLAADISVSITGNGTPTVFQPYTYSLLVANNGPDQATGIVLTVQFSFDGLGNPTGTDNNGNPICNPYDSANLTLTCPVGALAAGASKTVNITGQFNAGSTLTVTAAVNANEVDPNSGNNTDIWNSTAGVSGGGGGGGGGTSGSSGGGVLGPRVLLVLALILAAATIGRRPLLRR